jgi:hypothetical protein
MPSTTSFVASTTVILLVAAVLYPYNYWPPLPLPPPTVLQSLPLSQPDPLPDGPGRSVPGSRAGSKVASSGGGSAFHAGLDLTYPALRLIHKGPHLFTVRDFLSPDECAKILPLAYARHDMMPMGDAGDSAGVPSESPGAPASTISWANPSSWTTPRTTATRRATGTRRYLVTEAAQAFFTPKLEALLGGGGSDASGGSGDFASRLEHLELWHFAAGDASPPHVEGRDGPTTTGAFSDSARLVTVYVYLKDTAGPGGETHFTKLGLRVQPRAGMALLHFPTSASALPSADDVYGVRADPRTEHESVPTSRDGVRRRKENRSGMFCVVVVKQECRPNVFAGAAGLHALIHIHTDH